MAYESLDLASMLLLGLLGTGHCLGMCGPLVFALPGQAGGLGAHLGYHAGRVSTYAAVGALAAALGGGAGRLAGALGSDDPLAVVARVEILLSLLSAVLLLLLGLARLGLAREPRWMEALADGSGGWPGLARWRTAGPGAVWRMGVAGAWLGLLPCGLSYGAFARCLGAAGPGTGAALAGAFGLGTVPGLLLAGLGLGAIGRRRRRAADARAGVLMVGMGVQMGVQAATAILA
jgi:sulfite exporter TauE/SafE